MCRLVADTLNHVVRKVDGSTYGATTFAGVKTNAVAQDGACRRSDLMRPSF